MTYPFGRDVQIPNLEIFRCGRPPFVQGVRIGPSGVKALLDVMLTFTAARLAHARAVRRNPLSRGSRTRRLVAGQMAAGAPPLRHALQPASAVGEFRIHAVHGHPPAVRAPRNLDDRRIAGHHHRLPGTSGHRRRPRRRGPGVPYRKRHGRRHRRRRVAIRGRAPGALRASPPTSRWRSIRAPSSPTRDSTC